jgi:hypothetical protein
VFLHRAHKFGNGSPARRIVDTAQPDAVVMALCAETLTRPRPASAGLFYSLHPAALLLPRIVLWIHEIDILRAYATKLDDSFFASPGEVIGLGLDDHNAAGGERLGLFLIKLVSRAKIESAR